jgi:methylmalonyl-CoA mutase cobalamin-binding domain/chain
MDFQPSEEELQIQRVARDYADRTLVPRAAARDLSCEFPVAELRELGRLGLLAIAVPEALGGAGSGPIAYSLALQELARGDASVAVAVSVTNMVGELIANNGTSAQCERWNPALASGELIAGAFALSEPEAGSDPAALRTVAQRVGGGWRITGTKQWITTGDHAGAMVVWAVTEPGAGHKGITAFVVPGGAKGLFVARLEDKLGLRASSTAQLVFDGVEVGDDAVLGVPGKGFALAMMALDGGRIGIASQAIGIARGALEAAIRYAKDRHTFGQPIIKHQAIGAMLADSATWLDAATLMTLRAASSKQHGQPLEAARPAVLAAGGDGQAVRQRARVEDLRPRAANPRRLRLRKGLPGRARAARRPGHPHLRGHERDPADRDCARLAPRGRLGPMSDRKIRILVAKPGLDGHDRGAKVVARALADAGYEVVYTGLHQTPEMIAAAAVQEAVDAVGLSIMSGAHMTLFPAVIEALAKRGAGEVTVFGGGIVPKDDLPKLAEMGVAKIFTPGASTNEIVEWVETYLRPKVGN